MLALTIFILQGYVQLESLRSLLLHLMKHLFIFEQLQNGLDYATMQQISARMAECPSTDHSDWHRFHVDAKVLCACECPNSWFLWISKKRTNQSSHTIVGK